ncbi:uncharacterized protein TrAtP1_006390 [Trichoderma atroviride]|uniref:uncharacterized protein n=1 Tax=Hypocrea atroviridis TaxID=63577 RepID=UPI00331EB3B4|nr:hypothetical protein TrAtP1_006390 [Trichoderma atroviride]
MNSGDGFGPCRNHLCANILCSIAITSISPTYYSKLKWFTAYLGTPVALGSTFICLSCFSIVSDRPWMCYLLWLINASEAESSNSNSEANLSIYRVVSDDQVRYWVYTLILDYTYRPSNYTQSPVLTDRRRGRNDRKRHSLPLGLVSPLLLIVLWLWLGLF